MKKLAIFLLFFPVLLFAQRNTNLPMIESITGDTISGKYIDIIFNYDNLNRVKSMVNRNCFLPKTVSNPSGQLLVDTMQIQYFEYKGNQLHPFLRKVARNEYDRIKYNNSNSNTEPLEYKAGRAELKLQWRDSVFNYYIYQDNQRVRDSVIYHTPECCNENKINIMQGQVRIRLTAAKVETENFNKETNRIYSKDSIVYEKNISNVLSYSQNDYYRTSLTSTYSKFDNAINPFHHLNIASYLSEDKISFENIELNNILNDFNLDDAIFQWYYLNENNPLVYQIKRGKTDLPYMDKMLLSYIYNDYKLPVSCNVKITKYFSNGEFAGKYQKRFAFRYKGL